MQAYRIKPLPDGRTDGREVLVFLWAGRRSECEASQQLPQSAMANDPKGGHTLIAAIIASFPTGRR
jgi:hypothetical protein